ncbi:MAG: ATP-binding protein [Calditrichia bacterium]
MIKSLDFSQVRKSIEPGKLGVKSSSEIEPLSGIIGQQRAVNSLQFGLRMTARGYNVYVAGPPGTGKMTSIQSFLKDMARRRETPHDWCYVNNFNNPYSPVAISLPPGKGCEFRSDMDHVVEHVQKELPRVFESEQYSGRREDIIGALKKKRESLSREINQRATESGFNLQSTPMGLIFIPVKEGQPLTDEQLKALDEAERNELREKQGKLQEEIQQVSKKIRELERTANSRIKDLDKKVALNAVGGLIEDIRDKYSDFPDIQKYFDEVEKDIAENVDAFKRSESAQEGSSQPAQKAALQQLKDLSRRKYEVNVLVDNSQQEGAPLILELNPTFNNLLGRIEKEMMMGAFSTDFTLIKAGSLLKANGGFLIVPVEDLLTGMYAYEGLKRALRSCEVQIEELGERLGFMTTKTLRPQPIPLDVKVVLVGPPLIFRLMHAYDNDFAELFKVKADYDIRMKAEEENIGDFLSFVSTICRKENLPHLDQGALARVLEQAMRMAGDQERISTEFGLLADLIREAAFWAEEEGAEQISAAHVQKSLDEQKKRSNLPQERIEEMIERGILLIDIEGEKVGQVNGLSVLDIGDYQFGKPSRITATVNPGRGIVDIEREAKLGGPLHSKGVLILTGFLSGKYARNRPFTLGARLVFEQSYQGVDGDSASSAEVYAILSALSELPLKQGIAVTGSVNQKGEVQAIGGVNHKIEGFFQVCRQKGLTGKQGVIIPASNQKHLMLEEEVVKAVKENQFHIWAVRTIDEGIEILTGQEAGIRQEDDTFPQGSVNEQVRKRLEMFEQSLKKIKNIKED